MKFIEELLPLKLYPATKKIYPPIDLKTKQKGAAILLLAPDMQSAESMLELPYIYNPNYYKSLYIHRQVSAYINSDKRIEDDEEDEVVSESYIHPAPKFPVAMELDKSISFNTSNSIKQALDNDNWFANTAKLVGFNPKETVEFTVYEHNSYDDVQKYTGTSGTHGYATEDSIHIVPERSYDGKDGSYTAYLRHEFASLLIINTNPTINPILLSFIAGYLAGQHEEPIEVSGINGSILIANLVKENNSKLIARLIKTNDVNYVIRNAGLGLKKNIKKIFESYDVPNQDSTEVISEGIVFNQKDIEMNLDQWKPEKGKNILFITGLSGSGKTTLAENYEKSIPNATMFELDGIQYNYDSSNKKILDKLKERYPEYAEAVKIKFKNLNGTEFETMLLKANHLALTIMAEMHDTLFIIEGVQIYNMINPESLVNKPMVIKGTSMLTSIIRRFQRNAETNGEKHINWVREFKNEFIELLGYYHSENKQLEWYKKEYKKVTGKNFNESTFINPPAADDYSLKNDGFCLNESFLRTDTGDGGIITFFNEADSKYDAHLRRYLYKERIKMTKDVMALYNEYKQRHPFITKTYPKLAMYMRHNIFMDLSYYHGLFRKGNVFKMDKGVNIYWDFLERLMDDEEVNSIYHKRAFFIPVDPGVWGTDSVETLVNYKANINPISIIFRLMRTSPDKLKQAWGDKTILFVSKRGYFTVDFKTLQLKGLARIKARLKTIFNAAEEIIDDEEDEVTPNTIASVDKDSNAVRAVKLADKIEEKIGIKADLSSSNLGRSVDKVDDLVLYTDSKSIIPSESPTIAILSDTENKSLDIFDKIANPSIIDTFVRPKK